MTSHTRRWGDCRGPPRIKDRWSVNSSLVGACLAGCCFTPSSEALDPANREMGTTYWPLSRQQCILQLCIDWFPDCLWVDLLGIPCLVCICCAQDFSETSQPFSWTVKVEHIQLTEGSSTNKTLPRFFHPGVSEQASVWAVSVRIGWYVCVWTRMASYGVSPNPWRREESCPSLQIMHMLM